MNLLKLLLKQKSVEVVVESKLPQFIVDGVPCTTKFERYVLENNHSWFYTKNENTYEIL